MRTEAPIVALPLAARPDVAALTRLGHTLLDHIQAAIASQATDWLIEDGLTGADWVDSQALTVDLAHYWQPIQEMVAIEQWLTTGFIPAAFGSAPDDTDGADDAAIDATADTTLWPAVYPFTARSDTPTRTADGTTNVTDVDATADNGADRRAPALEALPASIQTDAPAPIEREARMAAPQGQPRQTAAAAPSSWDAAAAQEPTVSGGLQALAQRLRRSASPAPTDRLTTFPNATIRPEAWQGAAPVESSHLPLAPVVHTPVATEPWVDQPVPLDRVQDQKPSFLRDSPPELLAVKNSVFQSNQRIDPTVAPPQVNREQPPTPLVGATADQARQASGNRLVEQAVIPPLATVDGPAGASSASRRTDAAWVEPATPGPAIASAVAPATSGLHAGGTLQALTPRLSTFATADEPLGPAFSEADAVDGAGSVFTVPITGPAWHGNNAEWAEQALPDLAIGGATVLATPDPHADSTLQALARRLPTFTSTPSAARLTARSATFATPDELFGDDFAEPDFATRAATPFTSPTVTPLKDEAAVTVVSPVAPAAPLPPLVETAPRSADQQADHADFPLRTDRAHPTPAQTGLTQWRDAPLTTDAFPKDDFPQDDNVEPLDSRAWDTADLAPLMDALLRAIQHEYQRFYGA